MKPRNEFFADFYHYLGLRRLVMARRNLATPEAEEWMAKWSNIQDPEEKLRVWETDIGPREELARVKASAERAAVILAGNFQPILERGIVPLPPPAQVAKSQSRSVAKTKVSQSYLDLLFATERTIRKYQTDCRAKNDLIKAEKFEAMLDGEFEGVRLNVTEQRIVHGIFNCLGDPTLADIDGTIRLKGFSELHEAMGLERRVTRRGKREFNGREVSYVNRAFWNLARKSWKIAYRKETTSPRSRKPLFDVLVTQDPLFRVGYLDQDATGKKLRCVAATAPRPKGVVQPYQIMIKVHPALQHRFFRLLPRDPYGELREILPPRQHVQPHQINFIFWLHRHRPGQATIETNKRSLAQEIGLGNFIRAKQRERLEKVLLSDYRLAKRLGYLVDYKQNVPAIHGGVKDVFELNPAMIYHARHRGGQQ